MSRAITTPIKFVNRLSLQLTRLFRPVMIISSSIWLMRSSRQMLKLPFIECFLTDPASQWRSLAFVTAVMSMASLKNTLKSATTCSKWKLSTGLRTAFTRRLGLAQEWESSTTSISRAGNLIPADSFRLSQFLTKKFGRLIRLQNWGSLPAFLKLTVFSLTLMF